MSFLYPSFLWALLAIAIPIIIHLFYFRRFKKVYFTNVKFLKEVKEETSSRNRLKHLLILLSRIGAIVGLVLAFAQPFIPNKDVEVKKGKKAVSLFVDNSFSMSSLSQDVPLLEKAKQRAREIVAAYSVEDEFQIITNDFEGRHQRLVGKDDAMSYIDEIEITPAVKEISKTMTRQKQALNTGKADNKTLYIISDFQKNITDIDEKMLADTTVEVNLVPLQSVQRRNIAIDSCWFEAPVQMLNQTNSLIVKVSNLSDEAVEDVRLTLNLDNQVKPLGGMDIKARESAYDTVNVTILRTGWHEATLEITDFPVQFDDKYYFTFNVAEQVNILVINRSRTNKYLDAVFRKNNYFKTDNVTAGKIDYSKLKDYQLIVVNELRNVSSGLSSELHQYAKNGGHVLVFPNADAKRDDYRNLLRAFRANELESFQKQDRTVSRINREEFTFKDVFENTRRNIKLPDTRGNFSLTRYGGSREEVIMRYRDGSTFLGKYRAEKGALFLCSAPLDVKHSDLARSGEIFVPMLYKMALASGQDWQIAYTIGDDNLLETDNRITGNELVYKLKGSAEEFIPEQKNIGPKVILGINNQIKEADFYELFLEKEKPLSVYAFNYDRKESELEYRSEPELEALAGEQASVILSSKQTNFTELIGERSRGVILWKWFLIMALAFLLIETLLVRLWRN